ncbi:MAG: NAD(P)-binding domain-containing protein [Saprospiraceae bacterium]|nr:NAD(P)-binding domain-containing protein [Saprospiraceae bacterium]MBP6567574.1 NAD(P)-binding domain-containing protein [Saprospiraceae bacterium]
MYIYLRKLKNESDEVTEKIEKAKEDGIHEPVSLYPYINEDNCIKSGACITACPEHDILGIRNGRATLVNASRCIGHGACFHACPVEAITLKIGTEKRGVDLPHVNQNFETNVQGMYIAGELGGMGLIKNSVEQGKQAVDHIKTSLDKSHIAQYDLIIIGAGPAGISASLQAKNYGLNAIVLEQDSLGGTVYNFPRAKIVMTSPMDLPCYGKVKLFQTSKSELLTLWKEVIEKNGIIIKEHCKVDSIGKNNEQFVITSLHGDKYTSNKVLLAIGRRGSPRKLGVEGEWMEKVAYKLLEPELIKEKNILVVGGGDSAIESALLLAEDNKVTLSYRSDNFSRLKPKNAENINKAIENGLVITLFESNVINIIPDKVEIRVKDGETLTLDNDLVYIFAGGELPTQFLEKSGIKISKRFNYTLLSHKH